MIWNRLLRILSGLLLFSTVCFLWPRELDGFTPGRDGRLAVPDYAMVNAHYVSVQDGKVELESFSENAVYDLSINEFRANSVKAHFYNQAGERTDVSANAAVYYPNQRKMFLFDNVQSRSPDGFLMRGIEAEYQLDGRVLLAPKPVEGEMEDGSLKIWGNKATSQLDQRTVDLVGDARAHYQERKRGLTRIRGETAHLNREQSQITFREKVKVEQDKVVGTSNVAHLYYSGKEKGVRYMSLLEDVRLQEEGGRYTRSQVAEFFAPTDTIVLSAFPSVYHGDDVVTGDRITLYRATGVVEVTATNAAASPMRSEKPAEPETLSPEDEELIP